MLQIFQDLACWGGGPPWIHRSSGAPKKDPVTLSQFLDGMDPLHVAIAVGLVLAVIAMWVLCHRAVNKLSPEERKQIGREMNRFPPRGWW